MALGVELRVVEKCDQSMVYMYEILQELLETFLNEINNKENNEKQRKKKGKERKTKEVDNWDSLYNWINPTHTQSSTH